MRRYDFSSLLSAGTWGCSLAAGSWTGPTTVTGTGPLVLVASSPWTSCLLLVRLGSSTGSSTSCWERLLTAASVISSKVIVAVAAWQCKVWRGLTNGFKSGWVETLLVKAPREVDLPGEEGNVDFRREQASDGCIKPLW